MTDHSSVWATLSMENRAFVEAIDAKMAMSSYKTKVEVIDKGQRMTYTHSKSKRAILNYLVSGGDILLHLYTDSIGSYQDFVQTLPEAIRTFLKKGPKCKWLDDPATCNPKCLHGFQFVLDGESLRKCRYMCYIFPITDANRDAVLQLIACEYTAREAVN